MSSPADLIGTLPARLVSLHDALLYTELASFIAGYDTGEPVEEAITSAIQSLRRTYPEGSPVDQAFTVIFAELRSATGRSGLRLVKEQP
jgi:hypothetical protein